MRLKNKALLGLSILTLGLSIASCTEQKEKIGLFLYDETDTFVSEFKDALITKLNYKYEINIYDAKRSQSVQNNQIINDLDSNNPAYILVNMVDRLASSSIIQKANLSKTPVIFFNREPVYSDIAKYENTYYVGTNPKQEGINQGIMAEELMGQPNAINKKIDKNGDGKLQCIFLQGEPNHQDAEQRTYSCINYLLEKNYQIEILAMENANWSKDSGYSTMKSLYSKYGNDIEFVFSNNDDMALGAIDYLKDNKLITYNNSNKPSMPFPIVGVDGTKSGLQSIYDGMLYGTTINNKNKQAYAIERLLSLINKEISMEDFNEEFILKKNKFLYISGDSFTQKDNDKIQL